MANVYATKTGNWTDNTVWNTGAQPTSADDVYANNFTVTINTSPTILSCRNTAATGITAGGGFTASNGMTLTCTGSGLIAANTNCLSVALSAGQACTVASTVTGSSTGFGYGISCNNHQGTLNVNGNIIGGAFSSNNTYGLGIVNSSGTFNITGNVTGGGSASANNGVNSSGGLPVINITGDVSGGARGVGINIPAGTLNISGSVTGGGASAAFGVTNAATCTIIGAINGGSGEAGVNNTSTLTHTGAAYASTAAAAIGAGSVGQITTLTGPLVCTGGTGVLAAASGVNPCQALRWFPVDTALSTFTYTMKGAAASGSPSSRPDRVMALPEGYNAGYPAASNVRSGTTFGPSGIYSGSCAVPAAGSVALGVAVDNTTGTAVLTAANVRTAVGMASANLDTQLSSIPSSVWSAGTRTITGGTVDTLTNAPSVPSAATIASQVRTELSTELARIDVATSTRLAPSGTLARVTLTDTTTTLTNAPNVPSAATIASQVRTELATELGRIDVATSTRLAASGYTTPATAAANATAVRSELTPELARVANCATVATTGQQIQDALTN